MTRSSATQLYGLELDVDFILFEGLVSNCTGAEIFLDKLSKERRQKKLEALGINSKTLSEIRMLEPRERIIKAAQIALTIDEEPNSDFVEYIAGYKARAGLYHHFRSMRELLEATKSRRSTELAPIDLKPSELDLAFLVAQFKTRQSMSKG